MAENKRPNLYLQEPFSLPFSHAEAADTDITQKIFKFAKRCKITRVQYINVTGLAEAATNAAKIQILNGATVVAQWDTDSDTSETDVSIPADTHIELTLSATQSERIFAAGDVMTFKVDESGTTTVPPGSGVVEGYYF